MPRGCPRSSYNCPCSGGSARIQKLQMTSVSPVLPTIRKEVDHSFIEGGGPYSSSEENPKFAAIELKQQVTTTDTSKEHDTCMALEQVAILPKTLILLQKSLQRAMANSEKMKKYFFEAKKALNKAITLESELKKSKEKLVCMSGCSTVAIGLATPTRDKWPSFAQVFSKKAGSPIYRSSVLPAEPPTWAAAASEVELPDLPKAYSPLILSGFNEEKYMNHPVEGGNEGAPRWAQMQPTSSRLEEVEKELEENIRLSSGSIMCLTSLRGMVHWRF
ncbi:hypothetical protein Acr_01g0011340 [Actinidia rufa]|uniref:Uncharacterized protein n=1 Tax=Actinidia rufa TaxID=165716 RepID=A0A7J0E4M2_9ERIC|nr:hypothetical protein Acr_01g0011340 [Actinidia rufa]